MFASLLTGDSLTTKVALLGNDLNNEDYSACDASNSGDCGAGLSAYKLSPLDSTRTHWLGRSVKLMLDFASTVTPGLSLLEIHD
jgi:hypothetical protein